VFFFILSMVSLNSAAAITVSLIARSFFLSYSAARRTRSFISALYGLAGWDNIVCEPGVDCSYFIRETIQQIDSLRPGPASVLRGRHHRAILGESPAAN
jgi:hypothetical protein